MAFGEEYELKIKDRHRDGVDTCEWKTVSPSSRYDAIHAAAGALLAGADAVTIQRVDDA